MCLDQNHVLLFWLQVVSAIALPNLAQLLEATAQRFSSMGNIGSYPKITLSRGFGAREKRPCFPRVTQAV
jgi:hypothetical protein